MSKYDKEYQDFLEEKILNNYINNDEENDEIKNIINKYFDRDTIKEYIYEENLEYLDFILDKILKDDKEKGTNKYEQKSNYLNLIKNNYFQNQKSKTDKIDYLIYYLKNKYSVVTGNVLYTLFKDKNDKFENAMTINDYKDFILMNFNKETINLDDNEDFEKFRFLLKLNKKFDITQKYRFDYLLYCQRSIFGFSWVSF